MGEKVWVVTLHLYGGEGSYAESAWSSEEAAKKHVAHLGFHCDIDEYTVDECRDHNPCA